MQPDPAPAPRTDRNGDPVAPPKVGTKAVLDAQDAGYRAGWAGQDHKACPYIGDGNPYVGDPEATALLRDAWAAGWAAAATDLTTGTPTGTGE